MRSAFLVAALFTCACGSPPPAQAPDASAAASEPTSPGAQCLVDANGEAEPLADAPERIGLSHILVRHEELKRPQGATLSREDACLKALEALQALEGGLAWEEVVEKYSDTGKSTNGALGTVSADELEPSFAATAFSLETNQLSYVVETDRGFHVILRTE